MTGSGDFFVTLGKEVIRLIRMRQGVSSVSDEQVGSSSQSTVTQTNADKDEMEDVLDGEENVDHEDEDGEKVEEEVLEEGEEEEEESDVVRELLSTHSVWLGM